MGYAQIPALGLLLFCLGFLSAHAALFKGRDVVEVTIEKTSVHITETVSSEKEPDQNCTLCTDGINYVKSIVENGTKEEYEQALMKMCSKLFPPEYQPVCQMVVSKYMVMMVEMLMKGNTTQAICAAIGLCPKPQSVQEQDQTCDLCTQGINYVKNTVKNGTKEEYEQALMKMCSKMFPPEYQPVCQEVVLKFMAMVVEMLMKGDDAQAICAAIGLCPKTPSMQEQDQNCDLCTKGIDYVKNTVKNGTKEEYEDALMKMCSKLFPPEIQPGCEQVVSMYMFMVVKMLMEGADTQAICAAIGLCPKTPLSQEQDQKCEFCTKGIDYVKNTVKNGTKEEYEQALMKLCKMVPPEFQLACEQVLSVYKGMVAEMLMKGDDTKTICAAIGFCPKTPSMEGNLACGICKEKVAIGKSEMKLKAMAAFGATLRGVCDSVTASFQSECRLLLDNYVSVSVDRVAKEEDDDFFCKTIRLCP